MPTSFGVHCNGCPYENAKHLSQEDREIRSAPLSMDKGKQATVLLIFQAPGVNEWRNGRPVSSTALRSAGGRLTKAFRQTGKTRDNYAITNTVQCFPGKRSQAADARDKLPPVLVSKHCTKWLEQDIRSGPYTHVVVFGSLARRAVEALDYDCDERFRFIKHPAGGLSNTELYAAVS